MPPRREAGDREDQAGRPLPGSPAISRSAPRDPALRRRRDEPRHPRLWQVIAFAAVYLIWGSTYLAIRVGVRTLPPFLMGGCRFVCAGALLYLIVRLRGAGAPTRAEWARAALAGLLMLTGGNGLVTWAEQQVPSNLTALLIATVPLHVALLDWLRPGGVPPSTRVMVGIAIGVGGMALLVSTGTQMSHGTNTVGVAAVLLAGLCWAVGSLYSRYGGMNPRPLMAAAQQMIAGGSAMLLLGVARGEPRRFSVAAISGTSVIAFGYLTIFGSLVAFSAFGWLVKTSTPGRLSTTAYINPLVAVILGWVLLGETLGARAITGAVLILCAVVVMTARFPARAQRPARSAPE
jgi:drug/metabolite transporter (DMT)-like permease